MNKHIFASALTLTSLAASALASPLSDWFAKPVDKRGAIPAESLKTSLDTAEKRSAALQTVWKEYKAGAVQNKWNEALPEKLGPIQLWVKDNTLHPKRAKVGEKDMLYVAIQKGEKPKNGWPMYICLHGGGGNPNAQGPHSWGVNTREWQAQMQLATSVYESPGIYLIPRMADDREGRWYYGYNQIFLDRIIQQAILFNGVDPDRVYLTGISEGGYTAFRLGSMMADRWAGSCAMAAAEPIGNAPMENLRHVAFRCGIGENDTMFNRIGMARTYFKELDKLKAANPKHFNYVFDEQKGRGHGIDYKPGPKWISSFTRKAKPKHVSWTVIKQHDRHRNRLYWLALDNYKGALPLKLDAQIKGNNIAITANVREGEKDVSAKDFTLRVYLDDRLVDTSKPVTVTVNGKKSFNATVKPSMEAIIQSTAERGDPKQVYPYQIKLKL